MKSYLLYKRTKALHSDTSTTRLPIQISNSIIMNICFSMKQCKAIKTILCNQDLYNENILRLKVDISDMTLDEAQRIVNKMSQAKKDALNDILLGKVQPLPRYDFENSGEIVELYICRIIAITLFTILGIGLLCGGCGIIFNSFAAIYILSIGGYFWFYPKRKKE